MYQNNIKHVDLFVEEDNMCDIIHEAIRTNEAPDTQPIKKNEDKLSGRQVFGIIGTGFHITLQVKISQKTIDLYYLDSIEVYTLIK